jgi:hypothetical protein
VINSYVEIVPICVVPSRLYYFGFLRATMVAGGFCKSLGLWRSYVPAEGIAVTGTSGVMIPPLGLGVGASQPAKYYHYGTEFFHDFLN